MTEIQGETENDLFLKPVKWLAMTQLNRSNRFL